MTQIPIRVIALGPSLKVRGGISRVASNVRRMLPESIRLTYVPTFTQYTGYATDGGGSRFLQFLVFVVAFLRTVWYSIAARGAIFHIHLSQRGSFCRKGVLAVWLRLVGARYIVHNHAADGDMFLASVPDWMTRVFLWGLHGADKTLALTAYWAGYYANELGFPSDRILVLPNPAPSAPPIPHRTGRSTVRVLFLGRVGGRKGTFDLIEAFASLPAQVRERAHLLMAGDGDIERARELVQSVGCVQNVTVSEWLDTDRVRAALASSDIFALPSRGEGMSNALLEAMAWGLAIVTTPEGGANEFLKDGQSALLVRPGDVNAIAAALEQLISDEDRRLSLGEQARQAAEAFDVRHHVDKLIAIYRNVAHSRSRSPADAFPVYAPKVGELD